MQDRGNPSNRKQGRCKHAEFHLADGSGQTRCIWFGRLGARRTRQPTCPLAPIPNIATVTEQVLAWLPHETLYFQTLVAHLAAPHFMRCPACNKDGVKQPSVGTARCASNLRRKRRAGMPTSSMRPTPLSPLLTLAPNPPSLPNHFGTSVHERAHHRNFAYCWQRQPVQDSA